MKSLLAVTVTIQWSFLMWDSLIHPPSIPDLQNPHSLSRKIPSLVQMSASSPFPLLSPRICFNISFILQTICLINLKRAPPSHPQLSELLRQAWSQALGPLLPGSSSCSHPSWGWSPSSHSVASLPFRALKLSLASWLSQINSPALPSPYRHPIFAKKSFAELVTLPLPTESFSSNSEFLHWNSIALSPPRSLRYTSH